MSEIVFYHRTKSASFSSFSVSEGNIESDLVEALTTFKRLLKGERSRVADLRSFTDRCSKENHVYVTLSQHVSVCP